MSILARFPWKTALKAALFLFAGLVTLLALRVSWISYAGRQEWAKTKAELLAKGEKLSLVELAPPPIPDEQNFFADPMWQELADLVESETAEGGKVLSPRLPPAERQVASLNRALTLAERQSLEAAFPEFSPFRPDEGKASASNRIWKQPHAGDGQKSKRAAECVLALLALSDPVLSRIEVLAQRPGAWFSGRQYEAGLTANIDHAMALYQAASMIGLRARARIVLGDGAGAERDVLLTLRLAEILGTDPLLISVLLEISTDTLAFDAMADGIRRHLWTGAALENFESALRRMDLLQQFAFALRGERGAINQFFQDISSNEQALSSAGAQTFLATISNGAGSIEGMLFAGYLRLYRFAFIAQDQALTNRFLQNWIESLQDERRPLGQKTFSQSELERMRDDPVARAGYLLSLLSLPALRETPQRVLMVQESLLQTQVACALERYRLKNGAYPVSLDVLVPDFLPETPLDVVTHQPMRYERSQPGKFRLWSAGWNESDEGGTSGRRPAEGDWVWGEKPAR